MTIFNKDTLLGTLAGYFYRFYSVTWSYHVYFNENAPAIDFSTKHPESSCLFGHWHGDELALIALSKHSRILTLASQSKDGSIMAAALKVLGVEVIRGSSTRGGARALATLLRRLKTDRFFVSFALDGPNGPRHAAKPGIHLLACKAGLPIYQCLVTCDRQWNIPNTWNKCYLPKPFAKITLCFNRLPDATPHNRNIILDLLNNSTAAPPAFRNQPSLPLEPVT
ncbi:MAG: DUF374 domain-containing protein [Deltaproteobacteria bacterium]|nr:DUF374 domain-containing protein [Deltaproteobacteria bacterium]